jgi:hypothetical protein
VFDCGTLAGAPGVGIVGGGIRITERSLAHIAARHSVGGARNAGASLFRPGEDVAKLVREAQWIVPVKQAKSGNFGRVAHAGRVIGTDRATGQLTSTYTVITDAAGNLVTMFPGVP